MAIRTEARPDSDGHRTLGEDFRRSRDEARALGNEFADLANDMRYLVQKEAELARAEFQESLSNAIRSAIWGAAGLIFANLLLIFAFTTVMLALNTVLDLWLSALITAGIILVLTMVALAIAYARMKHVSFTPERTMQSVREDMEWAKNQMKSTVR